ncbi:MAG: RNA-binding transcriptional accessory protein [Paenibacillus sp.]|nr:RNA-binding transcriptional accessory protein [Paenibacillus sp.]
MANVTTVNKDVSTEDKLREDKQREVRERILTQISAELQLPGSKVRAAAGLLDEGNTIPFIARYRKEMTGELDENELRAIEERLQYLKNLQERKEEVLRLIGEQGKLTEELERALIQAAKLQEVEDLYRPFKQKRKTRASVAKERGLEPLAQWLLKEPRKGTPEEEAARYIDPNKEIATAELALSGAMDIIAEILADDPKIRAWTRRYTHDNGTLISAAKDKDQESVYEMYYAYSEPVRRLPPHRTLAINRAERENILKVSLDVPVDKVHDFVARQIIHWDSVAKPLLRAAAEDAYKRLIAPAVEREVRGAMTEQAEEHAITIFAENLRNLLLQPPVKGKVVMGVDPAFRTGCKLAIVDETGKMLEVAVTYPTAPHNKTTEAKAIFRRLIDKYKVELLVIGNGTASRETEQFVADLLKEMSSREMAYIIVNEAGASVYSASKLAQTEFPDLDVAERSAISIARRIQDPLAELVKIDPKSIGVGQYQHDVTQKRLEESLGAVVESAVNHVGVDVNTASAALLGYVAGINATLAKNIFQHREENGIFTSRKDLQKVPRLGAKAYEQCAGFLRISEGKDPLDNTPIHPESYSVVDQLFAKLDLLPADIGSLRLLEQLAAAKPEELAAQLGVGVPTLRDIIESLQRPGRDPREELPPPNFRTDVLKLEHLLPGMELTGTVRNVIDFGAFVDIGIKNDGLVHISQLSDRFVKHPTAVVSVGDTVTVWVLSIDEKKARVSLTMRKPTASE